MQLRSGAKTRGQPATGAITSTRQPTKRASGRPKNIQPLAEENASVKKRGRKPKSTARVNKKVAKKRGVQAEVAAPVEVEQIVDEDAQEDIDSDAQENIQDDAQEIVEDGAQENIQDDAREIVEDNAQENIQEGGQNNLREIGHENKQRFVCDCHPAKHSDEISCEKFKKIELHVKIATRVMMFSSIIHIHIGSAPSTKFSIHTHLIELHSKILADKLDDIDDSLVAGIVPNVYLPDFDARDFAQFVSWLYTGRLHDTDHYTFHVFQRACRGWGLGSRMIAPRYQNYCMDELRAYAQYKGLHTFLSPYHIIAAYNIKQLGDVESCLRTFIAHSFNRLNGEMHLVRYGQDDPQWLAPLERVPQFNEDEIRFRQVGLHWDGSYPWDDEWRPMYLLAEKPMLDEEVQQIRYSYSVQDLVDMKANGSLKAYFMLDVLLEAQDEAEVAQVEARRAAGESVTDYS